MDQRRHFIESPLSCALGKEFDARDYHLVKGFDVAFPLHTIRRRFEIFVRQAMQIRRPP